MAFLGSSASFSSLFGIAGQQRFQPRIIGLGDSLISASIGAKLAQTSLNSLSAEDRASFSRRSDGDAVIPPWKIPEETQSLDKKVRAVRELTQFIDLQDGLLDSVKNDADRTATFALFRAVSNLRVLAEYASDTKTVSSSLGRLDEQFQKGFNEVRDFLSTTQLDKLDLFLGSKEYTTETATRTGKNGIQFDGSFVVDNPDAAIAGLTGTEVFTVSITKAGVTDDITVDLSGVVGTLSLNNIVAYANTQIEALTALDSGGQPYVKHQTRFDVGRDGTTGQYGIQIDGTITEEVKFSAAVSEPTLYVASAVSQLDSSFATTSRLTEVNGLSGTLTVDDTFSFAGVDLQASEIKELTKNVETDTLSDALKAQRDKLRADALAAVNKANNITPSTTPAENVDASSITNIDSKFKVNADTTASRVAVDSEGGVYVVGTSAGSFGHQVNTASEEDVFLTKFDTEGNVVFSRLLGVDKGASVQGITVDSSDNVIIVGQTNSALSTSDTVDSTKGDLFVSKVSKRGDEVFRYQLDTFAESGAQSVAVNSAGDIFVGGYTKSAVSASSGFSGGSDALILKLSGTTGALVDSNVFGTTGNETIKGIAVDANDNLVVATEEANDAVIYRIDGTNLALQTDSVNFGNLGTQGSIKSIAIDNVNNTVYIAGITTNGSLNAGGVATVNGTALGGQEGFVSGLSLTGATNLTADFTTYISTGGTDTIADVTVQNQVVYVAGSTSGTLSGESKRGSTDGYVARVNGTTGALENVEQYGESLARSNVGGVAFTNKGNSVLETLGLPQGTIDIDQTLNVQTQTSARVGDYFYVSLDGGARKRITLDEGDTFKILARKLKVLGIGKLNIEVTSTSEGEKLKVSTVEKGVSIDLIPGKGDRDLLDRIGLKAGKLLPKDQVFGLNDADKTSSDLGGVFGLKLEGALHIKDKTTAKYVLGLLDNSISTIQRAYRSLEYNPFRDLANQNRARSGAVPPYLTAQLANFQTGLARLQAGSSSPSGLSFFV